MNSALKSFFFITISVIFCTIFAWFYLRAKGLAEPIQQPLDHPFLQKTEPGKPMWIAYRGGAKERPENTVLAFDHAAGLSPDIVLWADVRQTRDKVLVVFREQDLSSTTDGKGWIGYTDYNDVARLNAAAKYKDEKGENPFASAGAKVPTLKEILERYPNHRFVLNIRDYQPGLEEKLIETIDGTKSSDRILFQSEQDGILKSLREKKATWLYGTSQARATQLKMLAAIGLESMAPLKGDVYVTEVEINHNDMLNDRMLQELKRRKLPILAGPVEDQEEVRSLLERGAKGIITPRPSSFIGR